LPTAGIMPADHPPRFTRDDAPRPPTDTDASAAVLPLVAERLELRTETTAVGAVRVRVEVDETLGRIGTEARRERYEPTVHPVGLPAIERREPYFDGEEIVVPIYEERLVVERRLYLKEEVRLRRHEEVEEQLDQVPLRRERAVFERQQADGTWREIPAPGGPPVAEHDSSSPSTHPLG
jgi:stress response protein YsnF